MVRISKFALTLLSATAVAVPAGAAGPPIAYAKEVGAGFSIFVTNPNATGTLKLYSGPAKNSLIVDMNPNLSGGFNELAVVASRTTGFKIVRYSDAGVVQPIQTSMTAAMSTALIIIRRTGRCWSSGDAQTRSWSRSWSGRMAHMGRPSLRPTE
jgi:hypothetical protein